ncbi:hypothetical protein [Streptomyces shenzhenensis]|uniref:hypothetical protein n=1 Tax=Streptomyces shenzhenensis TaxID=943815 RepID=UPI0033CC1BFF
MTTTADSEAFLAALRAPADEPPGAGVAGAPPPIWLWRLATAVHEHLPSAAGADWAARLHGLLTAAEHPAGLRAVHVWHAQTVLPLLTETATGAEPGAFDTLGALHRAAARGTPAGRDTWRVALGPVSLWLHAAAYDRASSYAEGHAGARDHALANGFSAAEAQTYGHAYAQLSTDANARAFAEAHTEALGDALASAYAAGDARAYADTYPGAQLRAVVRATTARDDGPQASRLAEGLLIALGPVRLDLDLARGAASASAVVR